LKDGKRIIHKNMNNFKQVLKVTPMKTGQEEAGNVIKEPKNVVNGWG